MKPFNLLLPPETRQFLLELSEKTGMSMGEHIRRAIAAYLKKVKS